MGFYAASNGNLLSKLRGNLSIQSSGVKNTKNKEKTGTDRLSPNIGKILQLLAA